MKMNGKRKRGRPRQTCNESVGKLIMERGEIWCTAKELARDHKENLRQESFSEEILEA